MSDIEQTTITHDEYKKYKEFAMKNSPEDWLYVAKEESHILYLKSRLNIINVYYATLKSEKSISLPASTKTSDVLNKLQKHFDDIDGSVKINAYNKCRDFDSIFSFYKISASNGKTIKEDIESAKKIPDWIKINGNYAVISLNLLCKDYIIHLEANLETRIEFLPDDIMDAYKSTIETIKYAIEDVEDEIEDVEDDLRDIDSDDIDEALPFLTKLDNLNMKRGNLFKELVDIGLMKVDMSHIKDDD